MEGKNKYWNIYDYPEIKKQVDEFVKTVISWVTNGETVSKDVYKRIYSEVLKWVRSSYNTQRLYQLSQQMTKSYNDFNGKTEKKPDFIKEDDSQEQAVMLNKWNRFVEYTGASAEKNGKLKQTDNSKAWAWLKNNELTGFNCSTEIKNLPDKFKKLIVYAVQHKWPGVSLEVNDEGKKFVHLDYLEEICAGINHLF